MSRSANKGYGLIAAVYLLGLFIGALDTGIITPARTIIQTDLNVNEQLGIWMITIYTLAYAAAIPVMGKLADMFGRKYIYLASVFLFGIGSLFCGLAQDFGSFEVLLIARAVQAIGGGGIMPVATAEFGTAFPPEKRGMALGLVGGVYGIANVFGASAGSLILDIFGAANWQFIFYINIPICLFILIAGVMVLRNNTNDKVKPIDIPGIITLIIMILSLLYALKNINFFNLAGSIQGSDVYPFLLIFIALLPVFVFIERRAADPVLNLSYFSDRSIVITLLLSIMAGIIMIGTIFVPQFAENSLRMPSGSGGYFVIILGLFTGIGAPLSGNLIDRFGVKLVLGFGLITASLGSLFLAFVATQNPSVLTVVVSLVLIGTGLGFTMGTPLNYMMLEKTDESESNSALATLSLVRSIGTTIAPALMVAFIAHAGAQIPDRIAEVLPRQVEVPALPGSADAIQQLDDLKANPALAEKIDAMGMPDVSMMQVQTIDVDVTDGSMELSEDLARTMRNSDVSTIADNTHFLISSMFDEMLPELAKGIESGISEGISGIDQATSEMNAAAQAMPPFAREQMTQTLNQLSDLKASMVEMKDGVPGVLEQGKDNYLAEVDAKRPEIESIFQSTLNEGFKGAFLVVAACSLLGLVLLLFYKDEHKTALR